MQIHENIIRELSGRHLFIMSTYPVYLNVRVHVSGSIQVCPGPSGSIRIHLGLSGNVSFFDELGFLEDYEIP